jgi:hypothetical protein
MIQEMAPTERTQSDEFVHSLLVVVYMYSVAILVSTAKQK